MSRCGEPVTATERVLFGNLDAASSPWAQLGKRIGLDALAVVFDELAGLRIFVPSREGFFLAMYRRQRNERIRELRGAHGIGELAIMFRCSESTVHRALRVTAGTP